MKRILLAVLVSMLAQSCTNNSTSSGGTDNKPDTGKTASQAAIPHATVPAANGSPRILFVGNSHTEYYTSLPDNFEEVCKANNQPVHIEKMVTMAVDIQEIYNAHKTEADKSFAKTEAD